MLLHHSYVTLHLKTLCTDPGAKGTLFNAITCDIIGIAHIQPF